MSAGAVPRLAATGVTVRFGGVTALDDVGIAVAPASIVGLVGPNGAGKSTLFGVLSGLIRPESGAVHLDGQDISHLHAHERARRGLARTFQYPELFSSLTVREHLVLAHRMAGGGRRLLSDLLTARGLRRPDPREDERVRELLAATDLTDMADLPCAGLPLGISRRVELGRAVAGRPTVVLLDEPTSGLDARETERMAALLCRLVDATGAAILLVEHDVELVLALSQRVSVLDFGVLIAEGTPASIRHDPTVQAAYLGADQAVPVTTSEATR